MKITIYQITFLIGLFLASCASDKNNDPASPSPSSDARDKFVAYWNVSENSATAGANSHTVNITKSSSISNEIEISNFSGLSVTAKASVNNNILTIPYQQLGSIGFTKGTATLTAATSISFNYTTTIGNNRDSCTAIYTKQ